MPTFGTCEIFSSLQISAFMMSVINFDYNRMKQSSEVLSHNTVQESALEQLGKKLKAVKE